MPKQLLSHGLKDKHLIISEKVLEKIVDQYTRESGVRGLEKMISKMIRYAAKSIAMEQDYEITVTNEIVEVVLGCLLYTSPSPRD